MATVSLKNVTSSFFIAHMGEEILPPTGWRETEPTTFEYVAGETVDVGVSIKGTGLGYSSSTYPVSGTIKEVRLDFDDDNSAKAEVVITGLNADAGRLDWRNIPEEHRADFMWALMLEGNDTIDLGSKATAGNFRIDFAADGLYAATFCGNDTIRGDVGSDGIIIGDLHYVQQSHVRYAGNDDVRLTHGGFIRGDASSVNTGASLFAGNDYLKLGAAGEIVGDVVNLYGHANGGNDTIVGSLGQDRLIGDVINMWANTSLRAGHDSIKGGGGNDEIFGDEQFFYDGGQVYRGGNDRLYGESGKDTIVGGGGNDTIVGGTAVDSLTGGDGKDQFRFAEKGTIHADVITDFKHGTDKIALENTVFAALGTSVTSTEFLSRASGNTATNDKHIIYDRSTGKLWYDADDNGSGAAVLFATLSSKPSTLSYADFSII